MPEQRAGKASLLIVFLTVFIDLLGFGIVLPLLPRYAAYFALEGWLIGLLMASFSAMQFVFAPIWGRVSDRAGRRPILMLGLAGSTVSYALFGYATSLEPSAQVLGLGPIGWLFVTRIGAGIFGATIPTAQAYIADVTGPLERAKGMALIGAAFGLGFTFGPLLGAPFVPASSEAGVPVATQARVALPDAAEVADFQAPAQPPSPAPGYVAAGLSGVALLMAVFLLPESLRPESAPAGRRWLDVSALRHAFRYPLVGLILATMFLTTFAFAQFESTLSMLTLQLGLSARRNFFVFAYIGFVLALSQGLLVRRLVPRLGEFRMGAIGAVLMAVGLMLIGVAAVEGSRPMLYAVLPVSVIGFSALTPSLQAMLSLQTSETQQGAILGLGQSMTALARILGPVAGLTLFARSYAWPYWAAAALMGLTLLLIWPLRRAGSQPA